MKTTIGLFCAAFCLFLGAPESKASTSYCDSLATNIVANCGFETGDFTGWTLTGNDVTAGQLGNLFGVEGPDPDGTNPNSGNDQAYFGDLDANATTLSQTFGTQIGYVYTVFLYLSQDTPASGTGEGGNEFIFSFDGQTLVNMTSVPVQPYTLYSFQVAATTTSSVLSITLGNGLGFFQLDDVGLLAPEPSAWALLSVGLLAIGFAARRRSA